MIVPTRLSANPSLPESPCPAHKQEMRNGAGSLKLDFCKWSSLFQVLLEFHRTKKDLKQNKQGRYVQSSPKGILGYKSISRADRVLSKVGWDSFL